MVKPEVWDVENEEVRGQENNREKSLFPDPLLFSVIEFGNLEKSTSYQFDYSRRYLIGHLIAILVHRFLHQIPQNFRQNLPVRFPNILPVSNGEMGAAVLDE